MQLVQSCFQQPRSSKTTFTHQFSILSGQPETPLHGCWPLGVASSIAIATSQLLRGLQGNRRRPVACSSLTVSSVEVSPNIRSESSAVHPLSSNIRTNDAVTQRCLPIGVSGGCLRATRRVGPTAAAAAVRVARPVVAPDAALLSRRWCAVCALCREKVS